MRNIYILLCVAFIISSCRKNEEKKIANREIKSIHLASEESHIDDTKLFQSIKMVPLETIENSLIQEISKIMYDENKLFIFDKGLCCIFVFDLSGKHLNTLKRIGNGPGEYIKLTTACLDTRNKQIILYSDRPSKLLFFDYSGTFIKEQKIDGLFKEMVCRENAIYLTNYVPRKENKHGYLYKVDTKTFQKECLFSIPNSPECHQYTAGNYLTNPDKINFSIRFDNTIYGINEEGIFSKYHIDFGKYNFPDRYKEKNISSEKLRNACFSDKYIYSIVEISDNEDFLMFYTNLADIYIYFKKEDILKAYSFIHDTKYDFYYNKMFTAENAINRVSFLINMDELFEFRTDRDGNEHEAYWKLRDSLDLDDNPILMICELK